MLCVYVIVGIVCLWCIWVPDVGVDGAGDAMAMTERRGECVIACVGGLKLCGDHN